MRATLMTIFFAGMAISTAAAAQTAKTAGAPRPPVLVSGEFTYLADAASFRLCRSGRSVPVAMEGAYKALEAAYTAQRSALGAPLFVTVEGRFAIKPGMEGPPRRTLAVSRFVAAWPGESCERNRAKAALKETYWKIVAINGSAVHLDEKAREPSIVFRRDGRLGATAGCNRLTGAYESKGRTLKIGPAASTMMACPPPLAERERALVQALGAARSFAIAGPAMVVYDEGGSPLLTLQAVALR